VKDLGAASGAPRVVTAGLDRNVYGPRFSADGKELFFLLEEPGYTHLAKAAMNGGAPARVTSGRDIDGYDVSNGSVVVLETQPT
jgi:Tol biopolymer transport system component